MSFDFDIKNLQTLLKDKNEDEESDDDQPIRNVSAQLGPGSIGSSKKSSDKPAKTSIYEKKTANNGKEKDIWQESEVEEGVKYEVRDDPRMQPDYDIIYKQRLTSEELFLQMGNKTPATSSCEDMVVKIKLPGVATVAEIDLNVHEKFLDCATSKYRLGLHLPYTVNATTSNAKWDAKQSTLVVTMSMQRDLDFVNF